MSTNFPLNFINFFRKVHQNFSQDFTNVFLKFHRIFFKVSSVFFRNFTKLFSRCHQIFHKTSSTFFQNYTKLFTTVHHIVLKISPNSSQNFAKFFSKFHHTVPKISLNFPQNFTNLFSKISPNFSQSFTENKSYKVVRDLILSLNFRSPCAKWCHIWWVISPSCVSTFAQFAPFTHLLWGGGGVGGSNYGVDNLEARKPLNEWPWNI